MDQNTLISLLEFEKYHHPNQTISNISIDIGSSWEITVVYKLHEKDRNGGTEAIFRSVEENPAPCRGGEHTRPSGWKEQGEQTDGLVLPVMAQAFHYKAFGSSSPRSFQLKHRVSPE